MYGRAMFLPCTFNYKCWKGKLLMVREGNQYPEVMYEEGSVHRFPIYWTGIHVPIMGYDQDKLNATKKEAVEFLEIFRTMWVCDIFKYQDDRDKLVKFLGI